MSQHTLQPGTNNPYCIKVISWKGVIAGALFALGLTFLFNLLSLGLGLSLYTRDDGGHVALTVIGFLWMLIGGLIILFLSGWITGKIAGSEYPLANCDGVFQGFIMWTVYLISSMFVLSFTRVTSGVLLGNFTSLNYALNQTDDVNKTGYAMLGVFVLFLVGAIGACIGAYFGIKHAHGRDVVAR